MNVFRKLKGQLCLTFASFQFPRPRSLSTVAWSFNPRNPIIGELQLTVTWLLEADLFPKLWSALVLSWQPAHSQPHSHFIYFTLDILTWSTNTVSLTFDSPNSTGVQSRHEHTDIMLHNHLQKEPCSFPTTSWLSLARSVWLLSSVKVRWRDVQRTVVEIKANEKLC